MKCFANEKRGFERSSTLLDGTLFMRATSTTIACWVLDISAGGARVRCQTPLRPETLIVLYIDGVGRFEGVTNRWSNGSIGIKFTCGEAKRQRLVERLNGLLIDRPPTMTRKRVYERVPALSAHYVVCQNGREVGCEVQDISLQGVSIKTTARPTVGEIVRLGNTFGRVVRHHANGISISFIRNVGDCEHLGAGESAKASWQASPDLAE
jgi:hypothetical protein